MPTEPHKLEETEAARLRRLIQSVLRKIADLHTRLDREAQARAEFERETVRQLEDHRWRLVRLNTDGFRSALKG